MAKILFGGPQELERGKPSPIHDDLIARLRNEGHEVDYVTRGDDMMVGLNINALDQVRDRAGLRMGSYALVLYDTGLFYDQAITLRRAELFEQSVVGYLKLAGRPVIVLAEKEMSDLIELCSLQAGFSQIQQPYDIEEFVEEVNAALN